MRFAEPSWLLALWVVPLLAVLLAVSVVHGSAMLARFIEAPLIGRMAPVAGVAPRFIKPMLVLAGLAATVIALAQPQWNAAPREVARTGRDVCFVIDVSKSMLAEDLAPNRLERSKLWVRDVLESIRGDRVALVAFAGVASVKSPLTHDYAFVRLALDDLSPDSVARGGTLIGDAIRVALDEVFLIGKPDAPSARRRDIILITDGEDHESFPVEAAAAAGEAGVRIIAIGIGDETRGTPIPIIDRSGRRTYVMHEGERVLSRLDGDALRRMALASAGGAYFNVSTGTIELDRVYRQLIMDGEQSEAGERTVIRYEEKFQIFVAAALILLLLEMMIHVRFRR